MTSVTKECRTCKVVKETSEFVRNRSTKDGIHSYCKLCVAAREREKRRDPDYLAHQRELRRQWGKRNRNKTKAWARRYQFQVKYGITVEEFDEMAARQDGHCAICGREPDVLVVDHDHETGAVRELLCRQCNSGIGHLRDDPSIIRMALMYLERHRDVSQV